MNFILLLFGQLFGLYIATGLTRYGRQNGYSYGKILAIGLGVSVALAGYSTLRMASGVRCVEYDDPGFAPGRCLESEEIAPEDRQPLEIVFFSSMMATVPVGLLSLALRARYERKVQPEVERRRREREADYRQWMENWVAAERDAWHKLQALGDDYRGGAELITLAAAAAEQAGGILSVRLERPDEEPGRLTPAQLRKFAAQAEAAEALEDGDVKLLTKSTKMISLGFGDGCVLSLQSEVEALKLTLKELGLRP